MTSNRSITIKDKRVKQAIAIETARQESFLVGCFRKSNVPNIVLGIWGSVSVSNPKFLKFIGQEMAKIVNQVGGCDILCGIESAGIGMTAAVSLASGIPWIYARKKRREDRTMEAFEGSYYNGAKVVFIDNGSARGKGMVEVFKNAQEEGFIFKNLIVLQDFSHWSKAEDFDKLNVNIHSLITMKELVEELDKLDYFPGKLFELINGHLDHPDEWTIGSEVVKEFVKEIQKTKNLPYIKKDTCKDLL